MRGNIIDLEERELRAAALRRYPYLSEYCRGKPMHMACCLCYPRTVSRPLEKGTSYDTPLKFVCSKARRKDV
ncbi:MAG: hypothetical protein QME84_06990 [Actinomycetota bacterium]|nr:hypothetical protein [Actinomycetota bacterium]